MLVGVAQASDVEQRAKLHAALGDPTRLAIVDALTVSDRSPQELQQRVGDPVEPARPPPRRPRGRRPDRTQPLQRRRPPPLRAPPARRARPPPHRAVAAAAAGAVRVHRQLGPLPARGRAVDARSPAPPPSAPAPTPPSASTPAPSPQAGAPVSTSPTRRPPQLTSSTARPALTITVCDRAHEELDPDPGWLHWSIPDPVPTGTRAAFDATVVELRRRITDLVGAA